MYNGLVNVFMIDVLRGVHSPSDEYRLALYGDRAPLGADVDAYLTRGEVTAPGYTAGGQVLRGYRTELAGAMATLRWDNLVWPNASISARAALIYNASKRRAIAVLDLGQNYTSTNGSFMVDLPDALIQIGA
jgi:hypothetical protein